MTEKKTEKVANKEYNVHAPNVTFNNTIDYVYGIVAVKATPEVEGERVQVVAKGFDLEQLSDSKAWKAFQEYCQSRGGSPNEVVMAGFLANLGTRPAYGKPEKGQSMADFQKAAQKLLDEYKFGQRASGGKSAELKAKAKVGDEVQKMAADLGMTLDEFKEFMKAQAAKKAKKA